VVIQLIASAVSSSGFVLSSPPLLIIGFLIWIMWFVMIFAVILPQTDVILSQRINQLKKGALVIFITLVVLGVGEAAGIVILAPRIIRNPSTSTDFRQLMIGLKEVYEYNDATALSQQAVENLLNGQDPYTHANIIQALTTYKGAYDRVTPLRTGRLADIFPYPTNNQLKQVWDQAIQTPSQAPPEFESRVCYPAASFLLPAPFIFVGITDIRIVYDIFVLAGLTYAVWVIPKQRRLLFIGGVMISLELWSSIAGGEVGSLCFPLLLVAWLALNRNLWLSAIFMGLAVATKQTAWFFIPFYLILLWRTQGIKKFLLVLSVIAGIFLVTNLPFFIATPKLWLISMMSPMTDPMFPLGGGLIALVSSGILHTQSPLLFTILEGIVFIASILWYFRYCRRYPQTGPILAIIPLFFAWRSLWSYFFYVAIISLAYITANDDIGRKNILTDISPDDHKSASMPIPE
jgi:hypothetical protein